MIPLELSFHRIARLSAVAGCLLSGVTTLLGADAPAPPATPDPARLARAPQVEVDGRFFEMTFAEWKKLGLDTAVIPAVVDAADAPASPNPPPKAEFSSAVPLTVRDLDALSRQIEGQKLGNLLTAPRVTTKSGQRAVIEIIREYRYPTEYEKEKDGQLLPTAFETRNIGVTLEVSPVVNADQTIDLDLIPQIVDLIGFNPVKGGAPVWIKATKDGSPPKMPQMLNEVPVQPLFSCRKITTHLTMISGRAVLLGGMARAPEVEEDLPAAEHRMLFVILTARIIEPTVIVTRPIPQPPKTGKEGQR